jgi:hypothetical protein
MALELETMFAARLADDLSEAMDDLDILPPREAAANLRRALVERCVFSRKLIKDHPDSRKELVDRLKRDQMLLAFTREFRANPADSLLLQ